MPGATFSILRAEMRKTPAWIITILVLLLSACTLVPKPLTDRFFREQAQQDKQAVTAGQEPVKGPISLYEAFARALKYNLDFRLELQKKALALKELNLSRYELLPQYVANLNYDARSNFSGATSRSLLTGRQSLEASTSSERDIYSNELRLSWNILDFGLSYLRAKQAGDNALLAEEQKRKVVNRIIEDVRTTYWRAVSNDRLIKKLEALMEKVDKAINESREVESRKLDRPLTALTYQRELISIKRELGELQRNLSLAKIQLAALMNLRPGQEYKLVIPERSNNVKKLGFSPQMMEQLALELRPEIRELSYKKRINTTEAKAAILKLLPGLDLNFGSNYNENDFLFNNDWLSYGTRISWNLINVLKLPSTLKTNEAKTKVLDAERLSLSMAILTQVHVAIAQFEHSKDEYNTAAEYYETQEKILNQVVSASTVDSVSEQAVIREEMNTLVAEVKYDIAYADVENAYAKTLSSMGIDLIPDNIKADSINDMSKSLKEYFEKLTSGSQETSMHVDSVIH